MYFDIEKSSYKLTDNLIQNSTNYQESVSEPVQLQPDPPATSYQLQFSEFQFKQSQRKLQSDREGQLAKQINKLSEQKRQRQIFYQKEIQKQKQSNFLLQSQIMRLRAIISDYDNNMRQLANQNQNLQNTYNVKLQQLKIQLQNKFENEMSNEREKMKINLNDIKNLYIEKIHLINMQQKDRQQQLKLKKMQIDDNALKIGLKKFRIEEEQRKNTLLHQRIILLQKLIYQAQSRCKQLQDKYQSQIRHSQTVILNLTNRNKDLTAIKEETYSELLALKKSFDMLQNNQSQLENKLKDKDAEIQKVYKKYNSLQKQLIEFKNRKTHKQEQIETKKHQSQMKMDKKQKDVESQNVILSQAQSQNNRIQTLEIQLGQKDQIIIELNQQIEKNKDKIDELTREISLKKQSIIELNNQIGKKNQYYSSKISIFQKNVEQLTNQWQKKQRQFLNLQSLIESKYIPEIAKKQKQLAQKKQELQTTMQCWQESMRNNKASNKNKK